MSQYWGRPEATADTLRNGWLHTGDVGRMDSEGFVYIVDRLKDMIISGGFNIYSRDVEQAILQQAEVDGVAVVGLPDSRWGERVHAVVVLTDGANRDAEASDCLDQGAIWAATHAQNPRVSRSVATHQPRKDRQTGPEIL